MRRNFVNNWLCALVALALLAVSEAEAAFVPVYRGGICVADSGGACVGGDIRAEAGLGAQVGYMKTTADAGTVPVYQSTCYSTTAGTCTAWGLSLTGNGSAVGYLSTTAPDSQSANAPLVQSNGLLLQNLGGAASAYLWSYIPGDPADLVVTTISNPPSTALTGTSFNITDTTVNNGTGLAAASTTAYRLSLDNVIATADPLLTNTRSVPSLVPAATSNGTVSVTIPPGLTPGTYYLGACADHGGANAESNESNNCLASTTTIAVSAGPYINAIYPTAGPVGTAVTISGSSFGATQGTSTVAFNGTAATPTSWSATSISVPVPVGATTGNVIVTVSGAVSNAVNFPITSPVSYVYDSLGRLKAVIDTAGDRAVYNYDAVGNILSINRQSSSILSVIEFLPKNGAVGSSVSIHGTAFSTVPAQNTVKFNNTTATVTSATSTTLVATVPSGATTGVINVTTSAGSASSSDSFTVTGATGAPTVTSFTPLVGIAGTAVTITGTNFDSTPGNNIVRFNGAIASVSSSTATTINAVVPTATGSGKITVQTVRGNGTSNTDFFVPRSPFTAADVQFTNRVSVGGGGLTATISTPNKIALVTFDGAGGQWVNVQMSNNSFPNCGANLNVLKPDGSYDQSVWK